MASGLEPKPRTFAVLAKNRLFPRSVARGARIWGAKAGMKEVYFKISELQTDDYQNYLDEMRALRPDLVIFCGHYKDSLDFTAQLNQQQAFIPKAVVMTLGPTQRGYIKRFGNRAESMMGVTQWVENSHFRCPVFGNTETYVKEFMKKFGHHPTYQNAESSACGVVYQLALERSTRLDAGQVLAHLRTMDVETLYGRVKFNERGMNVGKGMAVVQVQDGRSWPIWPKQVALRPPRYPLVYATSN
jgi:branched-chain amino acid transport system substrate-binding protein